MSRLLPEETVCFKAARDVLAHGPKSVVVNFQGEAHACRSRRVLRQSRFVFIRDDGWTLAAKEKFKQVAYESWRGRWVGLLEVKKPNGDGKVITRVEVMPDSGQSYVAGYVDEYGEPIDLESLSKENQEHAVDMETEPISLDDMREWMKAGCPR